MRKCRSFDRYAKSYAEMRHELRSKPEKSSPYGKADRSINKVAVLGGAGGSFADVALKAGADVYLTGEISHHRAWDAYAEGLCCLEAGHAATEMPAVNMLASALQSRANDVQCNVQICASEVELFR